MNTEVNASVLGNDIEFEEEKEEILEELESYPDFDMDSVDLKVQDAFGEYLKEIGNIPLLTEEEEKELFKKRDDPDIKNRIIEANLRLVVFIARQFHAQNIPIEDLVGEGNQGLLIAVDRFDPDKGTRFSTYAFYWIRQAITRGITGKEGVIRIPDHVHENFYKLRKTSRRLEQELGRAPTNAELAEELGLTEDRVTKVLDAKPSMVSLSTPIGEDADSELIDFLPDSENATPEKIVEDRVLKDIVHSAIQTILNDREAYILKERYGLNESNMSRTLEDIGAELGITRERVRQLEVVALRKLGSPKHRKLFAGYFDESRVPQITSQVLRGYKSGASKRHYVCTDTPKPSQPLATADTEQLEMLKAAVTPRKASGTHAEREAAQVEQLKAARLTRKAKQGEQLTLEHYMEVENVETETETPKPTHRRKTKTKPKTTRNKNKAKSPSRTRKPRKN